MDGSSLGTQRAHLSGRGHLARGSCVLCKCPGGMFMVLTPTPSSLPLSTEKCSAQQQGLESLPEEPPDTSSSQAAPRPAPPRPSTLSMPLSKVTGR